MVRGWDSDRIRRDFPGLERQERGQPAIFFDGPAGSQVPRSVAEAVSAYLIHSNANQGGVFASSRESDAMVVEARSAVADFFGAADAHEIVFGANMTTITFAVSRALARAWSPGDEVIVTESEHDANYTPWVTAAREAGARVLVAPIRPEDTTLDLDRFRELLSERTRLVAIGAASNASGTMHPVREITRLARDTGALIYVDAVHSAPHARIDVAAWDADFVVASAYKFFGPHVGVLWGRRRHLEEVAPYKVRPAPETIPDRWMTGTPCLEGIAGVGAAVRYLENLGQSLAGPGLTRLGALDAAMDGIGWHERRLAARLLAGCAELPHIEIIGIREPGRLGERVPTFALRHRRIEAKALAERLALAGIFAWSGNFYALPFTLALGLEPHGLLRVGMLHYNTEAEVDRFLATLARY